MKPHKENSGIFPTKTLPFSIITCNKIKIIPQLSYSLYILLIKTYTMYTQK